MGNAKKQGLTNDSGKWRTSYRHGVEDDLVVLEIEMPIEKAEVIRSRAAEAGLSVENYMRQQWGFPPLTDA